MKAPKAYKRPVRLSKDVRDEMIGALRLKPDAEKALTHQLSGIVGAANSRAKDAPTREHLRQVIERKILDQATRGGDIARFAKLSPLKVFLDAAAAELFERRESRRG
jgi:hypothetical protein